MSDEPEPQSQIVLYQKVRDLFALSSETTESRGRHQWRRTVSIRKQGIRLEFN